MLTIKRFLRRARENYFCSLLLAAASKPVWSVCRFLANSIQTKIKRDGVTTTLPNGSVMRLARNTAVGMSSLLFWSGIDGYEAETSKTLRFFFSHASTFIDVGANCGLYSVLACLWNPRIKVLAFEPFQPIYDRLRKNIDLNHLNERVVCENLALSSHSGTRTFYIPQSDGKDFETTGTLADSSWQSRKKSPSVQVQTVRLDEYEARHPMRVDLVKIDVEDFESEVLDGMRRTIQRDRPFIICEILPRNREHKNEHTRQLLEEIGYTAYWITPCGYVRVSSFDFERSYTDFLLSPVQVQAEIINDLSQLLRAKECLKASA